MGIDIFISSRWGISIVLAGIVLDMLLGDCSRFPHPVRLLGNMIDRGEHVCRKLPLDELSQGAILALCIIVISYGSVELFLSVARIHATWATLTAWLVSALIIYFSISLRCLAHEAMVVKQALESDGLEAARRRVSGIVGRDTSHLDESQVAMATIETVAENFVDAVVSPLFYACLAGPALCAAYRAINTLDAMVGYRNDRYLYFGRVSARLDDLANWLPARLSVVAVYAAAMLTGIGSGHEMYNVIKKDCRRHSSPNSGFPESAFAGALGVRLGGPAIYKGKVTEYPWLNEEGRIPCADDIAQAVRLLYASALFLDIAILLPGFLCLCASVCG